MTNHPKTTQHQQIQDAKASLRRDGAKTKKEARAFLLNLGWSPARIITYENTPHMIPYSVRIKRTHTQTSRIVSIPALNATDAHLAAAIIYPNWIILAVSRGT